MKLYQRRSNTAGQQELRVLHLTVFVHAGAGVARANVLFVQFKVLAPVLERGLGGPQVAMSAPYPSLRAIGAEGPSIDTYRETGLTSVAMGTIGELTAAPETLLDQPRIRRRVDKMRGRRHLRTSFLPFDVAAGIRRRCIELQGFEA